MEERGEKKEKTKKPTYYETSDNTFGAESELESLVQKALLS